MLFSKSDSLATFAPHIDKNEFAVLANSFFLFWKREI